MGLFLFNCWLWLYSFSILVHNISLINFGNKMISVALYYIRYIYGYLISFIFCCKYCCSLFLFLEGLDRSDIILSFLATCSLVLRLLSVLLLTWFGNVHFLSKEEDCMHVLHYYPWCTSACSCFSDWMVLRLKWLSKKSIVLSLVHKRLAAVWLNELRDQYR